MKVLFDTCIIIDALQSREPFAKDAQKLFLFVASNTINGFVSANELTDIYYLMHKVTHNNDETRLLLCKLLALFDVIDTTSEDCINAVASEVSDFEDAVLSECAKRTEIDCIVTRNAEDFKFSAVKIFSPDELIKEISEKF